MPVFFFYNFRGPGLRNFSAAYLRALTNLGHPAGELLTLSSRRGPHAGAPSPGA